MKLKTLSLLIIWMTASSAVFASNTKDQAVSVNLKVAVVDESNNSAENTGNSKQVPLIPAATKKLPQHHKSSIPQMEELPHIHKFHKERVKKVKKHHSKLWVISQIILILCHISMLVIAFLHATH